MADRSAVQVDFDRLAAFDQDGFDHNAHYHDFLLNLLPSHIDEALDAGCGAGRFTRLVAARARRVVGIDFSANMIAVARRRSTGFRNIDFVEADLMSWDWPGERFDCIVSLATLHHMPLEEILSRMRAALRPGGTLAVIDLCRESNAGWYVAKSAAAVPASLLLRLKHERRLRRDPELLRVWREHGKRDRYLSLEEVRRTCSGTLPGCRIRRHLLWRYSLVWRKPTAGITRL